MPTHPTKSARRLPLLQGILPLTGISVAGECLAGIALAALAIPEVMGYARIAGMPVESGLYTLLLPLLLFAVLGSSRHLVVGADSATAAIVAAGLAGLASAGSPRYVALAGVLAALTGLALLVARVVRLGFLADFMSRTVLIGFLTGVGIQVAGRQLGGMLGLPDGGRNLVESLVVLAQELARTNVWTLGVSAVVIAVIVGAQRIDRRIPAALIAVAGAVLGSRLLNLPAHGVAVLGRVPSGLPSLAVPALSAADLSALAATAGSLFLVVLAQSAATSRAYAVKFDDSFDEDVDLVALGLANISAGLTGSFVVNGSPTKTEMVESAGGRTQVSQLVAAACVLAVLVLLTGALASLPLAVLSAVIFLIGLRLIDIPRFVAVWRVARTEFAVALVTTLTVVFVGVGQGILLAIVLSVIIHLSHSYRPFDYLLVREEDGHWHSRSLDGNEQAAPGVVIYRFGASLYYANANRFDAEVRHLANTADPPLTSLILSAEAIGDIDYTAAEMLRHLVSDMHGLGLRVIITDLAHNVREELRENGLGEVFGWGHVHHGLADAMTDALEAQKPMQEEAN